MFEYLKSFGFKEIFDKKENQDKVVEFVKKNYNNETKGYEYNSLNAETKPISSIQLCLEKRKNKKILFIHHSNNCSWKFRIIQHLKNLGDNYYLIGNNINNNYEINNEEFCTINIINKDILPSLNYKDIVYTQVDALATEISFFGDFDDDNIKYNYINCHISSEPAVVTSQMNNETKELNKENIICGFVKSVSISHESLVGFDTITYCIETETKFGTLRIYFSEDQIKYMKGIIVDGTYFECKAVINGDAYLSKDFSTFVPNYTNNLRLVSRAFATKNAEILRPLLTEDSIFNAKKTREFGTDDIIKKLTEFFSSIKDAKITCSRVLLLNTVNPSFEKLIGKECLKYVEDNNKPLLIYVETDENNKISKIIPEKMFNYSYTTSYSYNDIKDNNLVQKEELDPLYKDIITYIVTTNKVSTSYLQRKFKFGYNRATKIIESLEEAKIISEWLTNNTRKVLINDVYKAIKIYEIKYKDN